MFFLLHQFEDIIPVTPSRIDAVSNANLDAFVLCFYYAARINVIRHYTFNVYNPTIHLINMENVKNRDDACDS